MIDEAESALRCWLKTIENVLLTVT